MKNNTTRSINSTVDLQARISIHLTEDEARVLDVIVGYGAKPFVEWFKKNLGTSYLRPHEHATESLFEKVRLEIGSHLSAIDKARDAQTKNQSNQRHFEEKYVLWNERLYRETI